MKICASKLDMSLKWMENVPCYQIIDKYYQEVIQINYIMLIYNMWYTVTCKDIQASALGPSLMWSLRGHCIGFASQVDSYKALYYACFICGALHSSILGLSTLWSPELWPTEEFSIMSFPVITWNDNFILILQPYFT